MLMAKINDPAVSHDDIAKASLEYGKTESEIDATSIRWLELQEGL